LYQRRTPCFWLRGDEQQRAHGVPARSDGGHATQAGHRLGRRGICAHALPPALDRASGEQGARLRPARHQGGHVAQAQHHDGRRGARVGGLSVGVLRRDDARLGSRPRPDAELAVEVVPPALDGAAREQRAGEIPARRDSDHARSARAAPASRVPSAARAGASVGSGSGIGIGAPTDRPATRRAGESRSDGEGVAREGCHLHGAV